MTTTHTPPSGAARITRPLAGPAANLIGLPDAGTVTASAPTEVDAHLRDVELARQRQLDALPPFDRDMVTAAYRATVEQILEQVRAARRRVAEGLYGICTRCAAEIPVQRLELRPWVAMCAPCAGRDHA